MATFSAKQRQVLREADGRWNIMSGAVRSGKTHASFYLLPLRVKYQPPGAFLLAGKTERTLRRNVIKPLQQLFPGMVSDVYGEGEINLFGRHAYIVGANDDRAALKIQGSGLVYAYGDEMTTWPDSFFQMLKSRLSDRGAKCDGTCNPESPYHPFKTEFLDLAGDLDIRHWQFHIDDNPFLDPTFVAQLKKEYTGLWHKRFIEGLWVLAEGAVYDMFSEAAHVTDDLPNRFDAYYASVDYGTVNPTAFGLYGVQGQKAWKIREYYYDASKSQRQKTDSEYSQDMKRFLGEIRPRAIIVDPSATSFKTQLRKDGLTGIMDADNAVVDGIRTQANMLATGRYKIHRGCTETIREYSGYVWDHKAQARGEDKPLKQSDHTKDEERYFLHTVFGGRRTMVAAQSIY